MKVLLLLFIFTIPVLCQGEFLKEGYFGFGGAYSYSANDVSDVSGFNFAFTVLGIVDLTVEYASGEQDSDRYGYKLKSTGTAVNLAYIIKKRDNNFNLKLLLGYYSGTISGPSSEYNSSTDGLLIGTGFYPRFVNYQMLEIRLGIELMYGFLSNSSRYDREKGNFINTRSLSIGLSAAISPNDNFHLIFSPFASKDLQSNSGTFFFGVNCGLVLSFKETN